MYCKQAHRLELVTPLTCQSSAAQSTSAEMAAIVPWALPGNHWQLLGWRGHSLPPSKGISYAMGLLNSWLSWGPQHKALDYVKALYGGSGSGGAELHRSNPFPCHASSPPSLCLPHLPPPWNASSTSPHTPLLNLSVTTHLQITNAPVALVQHRLMLKLLWL